MKYTADCPECKEEFEVNGPRAAANGLECSFCGHKFQPETIHRTTTEEDATARATPAPQARAFPRQEYDEFEQIKGSARGASVICATVFVIACLTALWSLYLHITMEESVAVGFWIAGSGFSLAALLFIVAQLLHIRAALQKLYLKD